MVTWGETKIKCHKNGKMESDDLETGAIPKYGLDVEMIEIMLDGCLDKNVR